MSKRPKAKAHKITHANNISSTVFIVPYTAGSDVIFKLRLPASAVCTN